MSPSWFNVQHVGPVLVIRVQSDSMMNQDLNAVNQLFDWIVIAHRHVVLNLAQVECIDSTIIAKLIGLHKKITAVGGRLTLCQLQRQVREDFDTLRFDRFFTIFADEAQAVSSYRCNVECR